MRCERCGQDRTLTYRNAARGLRSVCGPCIHKIPIATPQDEPPIPRCANCGHDLFAHRHDLTGTCSSQRTCHCPGWIPGMACKQRHCRCDCKQCQAARQDRHNARHCGIHHQQCHYYCDPERNTHDRP